MESGLRGSLDYGIAGSHTGVRRDQPYSCKSQAWNKIQSYPLRDRRRKWQSSPSKLKNTLRWYLKHYLGLHCFTSDFLTKRVYENNILCRWRQSKFRSVSVWSHLFDFESHKSLFVVETILFYTIPSFC